MSSRWTSATSRCPATAWGYGPAQFNALWARIQTTAKPDERYRLLGDAQRLVANARLKGLWKDVPLFASDL